MSLQCSVMGDPGSSCFMWMSLQTKPPPKHPCRSGTTPHPMAAAHANEIDHRAGQCMPHHKNCSATVCVTRAWGIQPQNGPDPNYLPIALCHCCTPYLSVVLMLRWISLILIFSFFFFSQFSSSFPHPHVLVGVGNRCHTALCRLKSATVSHSWPRLSQKLCKYKTQRGWMNCQSQLQLANIYYSLFENPRKIELPLGQLFGARKRTDKSAGILWHCPIQVFVSFTMPYYRGWVSKDIKCNILSLHTSGWFIYLKKKSQECQHCWVRE